MGRKKKEEINIKALNIYNNKEYLIISERDNVVKAKDTDGNLYVMAKSDLIIKQVIAC